MWLKVDLINKYSESFLNVFENELTNGIVKKLGKLEAFLRSEKSVKVFLELSVIDSDKKVKCLQASAEFFGVSDFINSLFEMLAKHRRLFIVLEVIKEIIHGYHKRKDVLFFTVNVSHELPDESLSVIHSFLEESTKKKVYCDYIVDANLIAGIKAVSDNFIWEYSLRDRLNTIRKSLL